MASQVSHVSKDLSPGILIVFLNLLSSSYVQLSQFIFNSAIPVAGCEGYKRRLAYSYSLYSKFFGSKQLYKVLSLKYILEYKAEELNLYVCYVFLSDRQGF